MSSQALSHSRSALQTWEFDFCTAQVELSQAHWPKPMFEALSSIRIRNITAGRFRLGYQASPILLGEQICVAAAGGKDFPGWSPSTAAVCRDVRMKSDPVPCLQCISLDLR